MWAQSNGGAAVQTATCPAATGGALSATSLAYLSVDRMGLITDWNPAAERMFGWTRAEIVGQPVADTIVPPQMRAAFLVTFTRHLVTGDTSSLGRRLELPARHRDGHELLIEITIDLVNNGADGFCAFAHDSTGRREAEQALWESNSLVQAILDHTTAVISAKDPDGKYLFVNREFERRFQVAAGELVGRTQADVLPAALAAVSQERDEQVLRSATASTNLEELPAGDELQQYIVTRFPLLDPSGVPRGVCSISIDDTARRRSAEALRRSEERFERIVSNMPGMVSRFEFAPNGAMAFSYVSDGCREVFGVEPEAVLADATVITSLFGPEETKSIVDSMRASAISLEHWRWEGHATLPTGERRYLQGTCRPERLPDGTLVWDGLLLDRTREKRAERDSARARRDLHQLISSLRGYAFTVKAQPDGSVRGVYSSADGSEIFGGPMTSHGDSLAAAIAALVHPEDQPKYAAFWASTRAGQPGDLTCRIIGYDGVQRWVFIRLRPRPEDPTTLDGVCCDLTPLPGSPATS
ncbi:PAS domain S-box protein [Couchioplanes caeruleus]|uniref:PAS domain S-box protein n=1 Tax=Couchioplanes caeruleus TaxID=56438 RepID=UPI002467E5DA|nr:PAS domain S-box protein [Couchioplanes caeruleus]